jgi:lysophospholipase L1-like esterase
MTTGNVKMRSNSSPVLKKQETRSSQDINGDKDVFVLSSIVNDELNSLVLDPRYAACEIEGSNNEESNTSNCYWNKWRWNMVGLLAAVSMGLLIFSRTYGTTITPTGSSDIWPVYNQACIFSLHVNFSAIYKDLQCAVYFCDSEPVKGHCHCISPLIPQARVPFTPQYWDAWDATFARNIELANSDISPDVVMIGDSITEHWVGTDLGTTTREAMGVERVFEEIFVNGEIHGLALGLGGDRCPQLLYRLREGEMPDSLQPKVWWLLIGTNDLGDYCSQEGILIGTIQIVFEIRKKRPDATIVVNGILPRSGNAQGVLFAGKQFWRKITWINDRLRCFADGQDGVEFFNATDLFLTSDGTVDIEVMPDLLHPNGKGARIWGNAIAQRVKTIMAQHTDQGKF